MVMTKTAGLFLTALSAGLVACGGGSDSGGDSAGAETTPAAQPAVAASGSGYTVVAVSDAGSIRGTIRLAGAAPASRTVTVAEDVETCGASKVVQTVQTGAGNGLANAVVSITNISQGAALETSPAAASLDQDGCQFAPHVLLAPVGAAVKILNSDPITHNVHTVTFENRPLNRAQPAAMREIETTFAYADKVKVKCDIHEWMSAWVIVIDHPYHAITGADGDFVIENVPPGTYTVEIWHETLGTTTQDVTVGANQSAVVEAELSPQT